MSSGGGNITTRFYVEQNVLSRPPYNFWFQSYNAIEQQFQKEYIKEAEKMKFGAKRPKINEKESYEHISVYLFKKNVRKDITFNKFCEIVKNDDFKIYLDFYSSFAQGLLLKGYCGKYEIELLITEVNDIQFIFTK